MHPAGAALGFSLSGVEYCPVFSRLAPCGGRARHRSRRSSVRHCNYERGHLARLSPKGPEGVEEIQSTQHRRDSGSQPPRGVLTTTDVSRDGRLGRQRRAYGIPHGRGMGRRKNRGSPARGARLARRNDGANWVFVTEKQSAFATASARPGHSQDMNGLGGGWRSQTGCPARELCGEPLRVVGSVGRSRPLNRLGDEPDHAGACRGARRWAGASRAPRRP